MFAWLADLGAPVPLTIMLDRVSPVEEMLGCHGADDASDWVLRIDGPWACRYRPRRPRSHDPLAVAARAALATLSSGAERLIVQARIPRAVDGIALRTRHDFLILETQGKRGGNFYRDGSEPDRWIGALEPGVRWSILAPRAFDVLLELLRQLPHATCVEWVVDTDGDVWLVDAHLLPEDVFPGIERREPGCTVVTAGTCTGPVRRADDRPIDNSTSGPTREAASPIRLLRATGVATLPVLERGVGAAVFRGGGLLAHATTFAARLGVPVCVCANLEHEPPGCTSSGRLILGAAEHRWEA